jgi:hypothetical protein
MAPLLRDYPLLDIGWQARNIHPFSSEPVTSTARLACFKRPKEPLSPQKSAANRNNAKSSLDPQTSKGKQ